jgi:hypothetical protein
MEITADSTLLWELQTSEAYRLPTPAEVEEHGRRIIRVYRQDYDIVAEPLSLEQKVKIRGTKLYAEGEILMRLIEDAGPFAGQIVG